MAKSEQNQQNPAPSRAQRILASMFVGVIGTAMLSIIMLLIASAFHLPEGVFFFFAPLAAVGMLAGLLLMVALLIVSVREKARQNRSGQ